MLEMRPRTRRSVGDGWGTRTSASCGPGVGCSTSFRRRTSAVRTRAGRRPASFRPPGEPAGRPGCAHALGDQVGDHPELRDGGRGVETPGDPREALLAGAVGQAAPRAATRAGVAGLGAGRRARVGLGVERPPSAGSGAARCLPDIAQAAIVLEVGPAAGTSSRALATGAEVAPMAAFRVGRRRSMTSAARLRRRRSTTGPASR